MVQLHFFDLAIALTPISHVEDLITPQAFATTFCNDLDLPLSHVDNIVTMIRAQLEEHSGVVTMDVGPGEDQAAEEPDCRVILRVGGKFWPSRVCVDHGGSLPLSWTSNWTTITLSTTLNGTYVPAQPFLKLRPKHLQNSSAETSDCAESPYR